jgi:hypothetical protein
MLAEERPCGASSPTSSLADADPDRRAHRGGAGVPSDVVRAAIERTRIEAELDAKDADISRPTC